METFNFPNHNIRVKYPEGGVMKFGRGYAHGVKPLLPVARTFILKFNTMKWYIGGGGLPEVLTDPTNNMMTLLAFYDDHQMWKRFIYPSKIFGNVNVRFAAPLETPAPRAGGTSWTEDFELTFEEQSA